MAESMADEKNINWRLWFWRGSAVLLVVIFFVARSFTREKLQIRAVPASRSNLVSTLSTNGLVEPIVNVEFHAPLATTVKAIYVKAGDEVAAGKLLMELDAVNARARVASAESALQAAEVGYDAVRQGGTLEERQSLSSNISHARLDVEQAKRNRAALVKLEGSGASSASEVAASEQQEKQAEDSLRLLEERQGQRYGADELARAKAQVAEAQAGLQAAEQVLAGTTVRATSAGTVYSIPVGVSDFVDVGAPLLKMADLGHSRVRAYFDEPEIGRLALGQKIRIAWDARHGKEWHGHIEQLPSTIITAGTRNVGEVMVAIDDGDNGLLPDTHVTVTVTTATEANALTVPREALHSENGQPFVYRVIDGTLKKTPVVTGTINLTQVAISSGLSDGEPVATGSLNGSALEDGTAVKVVR